MTSRRVDEVIAQLSARTQVELATIEEHERSHESRTVVLNERKFQRRSAVLEDLSRRGQERRPVIAADR